MILKDDISVLREPAVTEKATAMLSVNKYVFKVNNRANKNQVKNAVEKYYKVTVEDVNIMKVRSKARHLGRQKGFSPSYKKAIVSVKEGQNIDLI